LPREFSKSSPAVVTRMPVRGLQKISTTLAARR
jgi:hypothetical protein